MPSVISIARVMAGRSEIPVRIARAACRASTSSPTDADTPRQVAAERGAIAGVDASRGASRVVVVGAVGLDLPVIGRANGRSVHGSVIDVWTQYKLQVPGVRQVAAGDGGEGTQIGDSEAGGRDEVAEAGFRHVRGGHIGGNLLGQGVADGDRSAEVVGEIARRPDRAVGLRELWWQQ